jgi:hypothetical protein
MAQVTQLNPRKTVRKRIQIFYLMLLTLLFLAGCSRKDSIERLMDKLPYERVPSYLFNPIDLPETASPEQCISVLTNRGDLRPRKILEIRKTQTTERATDGNPIERFTAVLMDTDAGQKILLLQPMGTNRWYFKIYDAR